MAYIFMDGCDSYGVTADIAQNWGVTGVSYNATAGRLGGGSLQTVTTATSVSTPVGGFNIPNSSSIGLHMWVKISATPSSNLLFVDFRNSSNTFSCGALILTTGVLALTNNGAVVTATGVTNICDNLWHFIDFHMFPNTGSQTFVDGTTQFVGVSLANQQIDYCRIATAAQGTYTFDDLGFYDSNSPAPLSSTTTNPGLTPRYFTTIRPSADSAVTFARSSGSTNFSLVNETAADGDTSYVQNATVGQADEYDFTDLSFTPLTIHTAMQTTRIMNPGAGSTNFKNRCHSGATTSDSTAFVVSSNYNNFDSFNHTDPNTAAAWSAANLNSAKFGYVVA